jgi:glycosyltransferase involved in cell wall biosynthesis
VRALYFGTYDREYPRNAQVISALRRAGVDVRERHVGVWEGRRHNWQAGPLAAARLAVAEARLLRDCGDDADVVIVGYPGHADVAAARRIARGRPLVFNPLVSLFDTFVSDRGRFRPGSLAARAMKALDVRALRAATLVVADTDAHAAYLSTLAAIPRDRVAVCFVGAEDDLFTHGWSAGEPFEALFVGKLIPLHGIATVLEAARLAPEVPFRVIGSGQLEQALRARPANVAWEPWLPYGDLPAALHRAGCALGIFGTSEKAARVIPNKVFQALACGAPVVTADTPGARELLEPDANALLVPAGDAEALAGAVSRLAADRSLRERVAAAGRATYEQRASEDVLGRRWRELLEGVAG